LHPSNPQFWLSEIAYQLAVMNEREYEHWQWEKNRDQELKESDERDAEERTERRHQIIAMQQSYEKLAAVFVSLHSPTAVSPTEKG
jgi:hypothetical protein